MVKTTGTKQTKKPAAKPLTKVAVKPVEPTENIFEKYNKFIKSIDFEVEKKKHDGVIVYKKPHHFRNNEKVRIIKGIDKNKNGTIKRFRVDGSILVKFDNFFGDKWFSSDYLVNIEKPVKKVTKAIVNSPVKKPPVTFTQYYKHLTEQSLGKRI